MPEGPSIVILTELVRAFEGRTISAASGNSKAVPFNELPGQPVLSLRSWGKHFLIELPLYLVVLAAVAIGFAIGQSSAWISADRWRREVRRRGRHIASLERELTATQAQLPSVDAGPAPVPALRRS